MTRPYKTKNCAICLFSHHGLGLCKKHYDRAFKWGDPYYINNRGPTRVEIPSKFSHIKSPTELGKLLRVTRQRAYRILNRRKL